VALLFIFIAHHYVLVAIIVALLQLHLAQHDWFLLKLEASFIVHGSRFPEVVQFILVLEAHNMLVVLLLLLQKHKLCIFSCSLRRCSYVLKHLPRHINIVPNLIRHRVP
jgi:hypothetical protein